MKIELKKITVRELAEGYRDDAEGKLSYYNWLEFVRRLSKYTATDFAEHVSK